MGFYQNVVSNMFSNIGLAYGISEKRKQTEVSQELANRGYEAEQAKIENKDISNVIEESTKGITVSHPLFSDAYKVPYEEAIEYVKNVNMDDYTKDPRYISIKSEYDKKEAKLRPEYRGKQYTIEELRNKMESNRDIISNYEDLMLKNQYKQDLSDILIYSGILGGRK